MLSARPTCNICGHDRFGDTRHATGILCLGCGSVERTRLVKMHLDRLRLPRPGMRVAHFAPEEGLARHLLSVVGDGYEPYNLNVALYRFVDTRPFDLCKDVFDLPSEAYDVIIHNHVLEHLPCNYTMTLLHLHRALKPGGRHLFSIPFNSAHFEEHLDPDLSKEERVSRFRQAGHIRNFGREDIMQTLGMIFDFEVDAVVGTFGSDELLAANIQKGHDRITGATVFSFAKDDCRLRMT